MLKRIMRTRDELGDAMRRLVAEANEVAAQRGFPSKVLFAPGPGSPEDEQDIRSLNTERRRFEAGIIEWGPLRYEVTILSGALKYVDDVAVIYCDIPGGRGGALPQAELRLHRRVIGYRSDWNRVR